MSTGKKLLGLFLILGITLFYSAYERETYNKLAFGTFSEILRKLPDFKVKTVYGSKLISRSDILSAKGKITYIHIWGTWCAPCEAEFPDLVQFINSMKDKNAQFVLLAVNDDTKKIKKFLTQFDNISADVIILEDPDGVVMDLLGSVKVPETYVFNDKGDHLRRYVGSQSWSSKSFLEEFVKMEKGEKLFQ